MLLKMGLGVWLMLVVPFCALASSSEAETPIEGVEKFLDGLSAELENAQKMLQDEKFREFLRKKYAELQKMGEVTTEEFRDLVEKFKKEYEQFKNEEGRSSSEGRPYI